MDRILGIWRSSGCNVNWFWKSIWQVPHQRLLLYWKSYNVHDDNIQCISSFLQSRCQRVVLNNSSSDSFPVLSGIPQGTILGPLLLLIYVNDLPQHYLTCLQMTLKFLLHLLIANHSDQALITNYMVQQMATNAQHPKVQSCLVW